ncbi:hypothetical protein LSTR_LSTR000190 [Laodelphax striatellus]|uniref:C2HC/C3H-type domain-containing protein n=1 Tax=Laodelphax striatellus TaxID=195883 RepID=A0A482X748_LAOST|nr:hypothetical protein LSTR_LSTR000190 [Laodelphax striatellus]
MSTSVYRRMPVPSTASSTMTATWPGKVGKLPKKPEPKSKRPETATLEKPLVLDPKLLRKLDMTTLCREKLLTIENLIISPRSDSGKMSREKERCSTGEPKTKRVSRGLNTTYRIRSNGRKRLADVFAAAPAANVVSTPMEAESQAQTLVKRVSKVPGKRSPLYPKEKRKVDVKTLKTVKEAMMMESVTESVPPTCCTCGRSEQPERLHSHPVRAQLKKTKVPRSLETENLPSSQIQPKSSVRKPNAIKFRSNKINLPEPIPEIAKQSPVARKNTFRIDSSKKPEPLQKVPPDSPRKSPKISQIPISRRQFSKPSVPPKTPPPFVPTLNPVQHSPPSTGCSRERPQGDTSSAATSPSSSPRKPRTVVCYLCMREFGTASLPLHEPHCLQRWERENAALPAHLRRSPPSRPDRALSPSDWNKFAYETAQASLVPCDKCGRTFLPSRLPLHVKACLGIKRSSIPTATPTVSSIKVIEECKSGDDLTSVVKEGCFICGRVVTPNELANHEEACLARWQADNDKLEPHLRHPLPARPGQEGEARAAVWAPREAHAHQHSTPTLSTPNTLSQPTGLQPTLSLPTGSQPSLSPPTGSQPTLSPRKRLSVCWLCGREFGSASIRIHEPRCLKRWHLENDQLPPERRRPEPQKPAVILTSDGKVDRAATDEVFWQSHLVQLVPCSKCHRTFNPDRVDVHEKACKGPIIKH